VEFHITGIMWTAGLCGPPGVFPLLTGVLGLVAAT
jgi:hypothetical protein